MSYSVRLTFFVCLVYLSGGRPAAAQTDSASLNASVTSQARLSVSTLSISFPDADPDTIPSIPALPGPVTMTVKARTFGNGPVTLTVRATGDLRSGLSTIPASQITWTATGSGFVGGTLSATAAQTVASWIGSGVRTGTQSFFFRNLWSYHTGTYTLTMTFTLSAA
jgi:hypothetical protein